ncbi:TasA family protein [Clostridium sp. D33t1_170424_F3]|uniref:TasA family protein n=1 Tax=Clostridium sp. D33t1_170424_F3 TaxID=2787099 RepID=UPI0018A88798
MKTKKSRIALSALSLVLVLALLAGGTMAWFTDTEKVNANFAAGVLDINVNPSKPAEAPLEFTNLRPLTVAQFDAELVQEDLSNKNTEGFDPTPVYFQPVTITNDGTLPVYIQITAESLFEKPDFACPAGGEENITLKNDNMTVNWDKEGERAACTNGLADKLKIFVYAKNGSGNWVRQDGVNLNEATLETGENGEKLEKAAFTPSKENYIAANGSVTYVIGGYLPENTDNQYQGKHYHGNVVVNAYQTDDGAGINPPDEPDTVRNTINVDFKEKEEIIGRDTYTFTAKVNEDEYVLRPEDLAGITPAGYKVTGLEEIRTRAATGLQMVIPLENGKVVNDSYKAITAIVEKRDTPVTNQMKVKFRNTADGGLLAEERDVTLSGLGVFTITTAGSGSDTVKVVAVPEGYVYDPSVQSEVVTVTEDGPGSDSVIFTVKAERDDPPDPSEAFTVKAKFVLHEENDVTVETRDIPLTGADFMGGTQVSLAAASAVTSDALPKVAVNAPNGCVFDPAAQSSILTYAAADQTVSPSEVTFTVDLDNPADCPYPHVLRTQSDLDQVRNHMGHTFVVANDLSLSGNWTPLGGSNTYQKRADANPSAAFTGNFYGGGHTISNVKVVRSNGRTYYWGMDSLMKTWYPGFNGGSDELYYNRGLFARNNGKISGVKLANASVQASALAGALAGQNGAGGVIENCQVTGGSVSVDFMACVNNSLATTMPYSGNYTQYGALAGGLTGANAGVITGSSAAVTVTTSAPSQVWVGVFGELFPSSIDNIRKNTGEIAGLNTGTIR